MRWTPCVVALHAAVICLLCDGAFMTVDGMSSLFMQSIKRTTAGVASSLLLRWSKVSSACLQLTALRNQETTVVLLHIRPVV